MPQEIPPAQVSTTLCIQILTDQLSHKLGDDVLVSLYEDGLKPEIQEKLIWKEQPDMLSKFIEQVVKINNKIYDFNARKKETTINGTHE